MTAIMTTDHPAWAEYGEGVCARAVRTSGGAWVVSWDATGLRMRCVSGTEDAKPVAVTTDPGVLPRTVPDELRTGLLALGPSQRLANPWLWDAITTAILRQVVQAAQARKLYRRWCASYGSSLDSSFGPLALAPTPGQVLALTDDDFAVVGAKFHRSVLRSAAEHYARYAVHWTGMNAAELADALTDVPRIGPWTAAAAATDFTGDFSIYPHDDLAVRTWAAKIAPSYSWPGKKDKTFGPKWTGMAGSDSTNLHTLTLSTLTWGSHAR
ncbi:hypothetical protein PUR49_27350 [Streptomyces sp. BE147]|uniref:hypothetical protein n=1 Tax=Streptomyces sp. BE147 TaxID=3002524 RepID=UPI002E77C4C4|nr:hypothetical protein [Streptomyces sp. BE147]MEE1740188.1 hypothetical protein [Streptomyces sp. BE147]